MEQFRDSAEVGLGNPEWLGCNKRIIIIFFLKGRGQEKYQNLLKGFQDGLREVLDIR